MRLIGVINNLYYFSLHIIDMGRGKSKGRKKGGVNNNLVETNNGLKIPTKNYNKLETTSNILGMDGIERSVSNLYREQTVLNALKRAAKNGRSNRLAKMAVPNESGNNSNISPIKQKLSSKQKRQSMRRKALFNMKCTGAMNNGCFQKQTIKNAQNRPTTEEELCERIRNMLGSVGCKLISDGCTYINFDLETDTGSYIPRNIELTKKNDDIVNVVNGHYHIISFKPIHIGARICFEINGVLFSLEIDHGGESSGKFILKQRPDGCFITSTFIQNSYYTKSSSDNIVADHIANIIMDMALPIDKRHNINIINHNKQQLIYIVQLLKQLYSIIISANHGLTYREGAGILSGGKSKKRRIQKHKKKTKKRRYN